jgi:hypothetical protein
MDGNAYVEVVRQANPWRDRMRDYRILLDGTETGKVSWNSSWLYSVSPGQHRLRLKLDWCWSPEVSFSVQSDETASFICGPSGGTWRIYYDGTIGRKRYISLRQR